MIQSSLPGPTGVSGPRLGAVLVSGPSRDKLNSGVLTKYRAAHTSPHTLMGRYLDQIYNRYIETQHFFRNLFFVLRLDYNDLGDIYLTFRKQEQKESDKDHIFII